MTRLIVRTLVVVIGGVAITASVAAQSELAGMWKIDRSLSTPGSASPVPSAS
jgi:hypothetical protein